MKLFLKPLFIVVMLFHCMAAFSQISTDSLKASIGHLYDVDSNNNKLNSDLVSLSHKYSVDSLSIIIKQNIVQINTYSQPDTALRYATATLDLAKKINSDEDIAGSYQQLGEIFRVMGNYPKAVELTLKGLPFFEKIKDTPCWCKRILSSA